MNTMLLLGYHLHPTPRIVSDTHTAKGLRVLTNHLALHDSNWLELPISSYRLDVSQENKLPENIHFQSHASGDHRADFHEILTFGVVALRTKC
jgi:hypothetical protein